MRYRSTRGGSPEVTAAEAVVKGIAPDGGLYVPSEIPDFAPGELIELAGFPYARRALAVLSKFFDDLGADELARCVDAAWGAGSRFDSRPDAAPVKAVEDVYLMELWHGPTCAFKDIALQFLPRVMEAARKKLGVREKTLILTATSGDTGKAALEGFQDVPGTHCAVFYPEGGVSAVQRLQMVTQRGGNMSVIAVRGNFDDAQNGVKQLFADGEFNELLRRRGWALSSANSINWGRLAPQIVYYVSAWCELYAAGEIRAGEPVDFVVPTGNFGNILAAWYARAMGLPVGRLVCASNQNRVLTDFFTGGTYDVRRPFYKTISPSMDIIISSNLERLLFELSGREGAAVNALMEELKTTGTYTISPALRLGLGDVFAAGSADDGETSACIREVFGSMGYLLDPHTAVGWKVWKDLGTDNKTVIVSTASPYKFAGDVLNALEEENLPRDGGKADCDKVLELTGVEPPAPVQELWTLPALHNPVCDTGVMAQALLEALEGSK